MEAWVALGRTDGGADGLRVWLDEGIRLEEALQREDGGKAPGLVEPFEQRAKGSSFIRPFLPHHAGWPYPSICARAARALAASSGLARARGRASCTSQERELGHRFLTRRGTGYRIVDDAPGTALVKEGCRRSLVVQT